MSKKIEIQIEADDVEFILGNNYEKIFGKCTTSVWCLKCDNRYQGTIVNYQIYLNELGDIVLDGACKDCNNWVGRYIESGENKESYNRAMHIREIKINLLKDFKVRKKKK